MNKTSLRVLIVEDSEFDALILVNALRKGGYKVSFERVETSAAMAEALAREPWDIVLADYNMPSFSAPEALRILQKSALDLPFIIVSGGIGEDIAVAAMKSGAHDYLMKGNLARLVPAVERELREAETRTARCQAEAAVRESEMRYRLLWENSADAVLMMDPDGAIQFANPAVEKVFGFAPNEVIGQNLSMLFAKETAGRLQTGFESFLKPAAEKQKRTIIEVTGLTKDSRQVVVEIAFNDLDLQGKRCVVAFMRDITERRKAEQALQESQELFRSFMNNSPAVAFMKDEGGRYVYVNEPFERLFNVRLSQFRGKTDFDWLPAQTAKEVREHDLDVLINGKTTEVLETLPDPAGKIHHWLMLKFPLRDTSGRKLLGGVAIDITERKHAEQALRETQEQFRVAREIQQRLFPKVAPLFPELDIAGASFPAEATGGDYFDYLPMLHDRLGVVIGDVTGHGIGPALLMAETRAYLRILARNRDDAGDILTRVNRVLAEDVGSERFVTLLMAKIDPNTRSLQFASAGHPAAYVISPSGEVRVELRRTGIPLGMHPDTKYVSAPPVILAPGELVLFLTDGIEETMAPNDSFFGVERALDLVRSRRHLAASQIVYELYQAVREFAQNAPQHDDVTAVVMKVK